MPREPKHNPWAKVHGPRSEDQKYRLCHPASTFLNPPENLTATPYTNPKWKYIHRNFSAVLGPGLGTKVGGLVYLWSTCGPMELGPAFSKVLTIKGGGHRVGCQKGGSGGRASCHRSRSFGSSYPRRKEGRSESPGRRQEFQGHRGGSTY